MTTRVAVLVSLVLTAAAAAHFGWVYAALPDQIPSHWNLHGEVDGWTSKRGMAVLMPAVMLVMVGFMLAGQWLSPRGWDVAPFRRTFNLIMVLVVGLLAYIWIVATRVALNPDLESGRLIVGGLLLFLAAIGNFLGKVRKNFWVGIRLPWTLASDRVWVATHRLAARLLTAAGLIGAVAVFAGAPMWAALAGLMAAIAVPCVYALVLYKRQEPPAATAAAVMIAGFALAVGGPAPSAEAQPAASEVAFAGSGGLELQGTLLMPEVSEGQRIPAAVLLPGSGPPDRDGNVRPMLVTDLLKQIAEHLAEEGIATLRYDKRSVAASYSAAWPTELAEINEFFAWEHFVGDARAAAAFLREQEGIDPARVALVGHSEGGLITLQIAHDTAGKDDAPAAIVLLATAGRRLDDVVRVQVADALERQGAPEEIRQSYTDALEKAIAQVREEGTVPDEMPVGLRALFNPTSVKLLRSYFTIEPDDLAGAYPGPVLIVQGDKDIQVLAEADTPILRRAFEGRERGSVDVLVVERMSHNFKAVSGPRDLGFLGPVVPEALERIAGWLRETLDDR